MARRLSAMDIDIETSREYQDAIDGDRALALRFWQQIADNQSDVKASSRSGPSDPYGLGLTVRNRA